MHLKTSFVENKNVTQHPVTFGAYIFDRTNAILSFNGNSISLTPKAFAVLGMLIDSAGKLVTKEALFEAIWPNLIVTEAALTVCIREIRKALGDEPHQPNYIETVHKHGFRFIGKINCRQTIDSHGLVGRDNALTQLKQTLEKVTTTSARQIIFISGEAGIGKTSLLEVFIESQRQSNNYWIAKGQCIEHYGIGEAYLPLLDALGRLCREFDDESLPNVLARYAPSWIPHLPSLHSRLDKAEVFESIAKASPERMMREIAEALEAISLIKPLILCLEDLHWCDQSTTDFLSFIARRSDPTQLCIIATLRLADAIVNNMPLRDVKQDLQLRGMCTQLPLELLSTENISEYLTKYYSPNNFSEHFADFIHHQTDGNSLFVINVLAELLESGILKQENGCWCLQANPDILGNIIPDNLQKMINQQIDRLAPECQALLEAASVAAEPGGVAVRFTLTESAAALGLDVSDIEGKLEKLAQAGFYLRPLGLVEWPDNTLTSCYEFTHSIYQNVIYQRINPTQKTLKHKRLGYRLEQGYLHHYGEVAYKLAVHFENGREFLKANYYLCHTANEASRRGANREAILSLRKAQQLLLKLPQTMERDRHELQTLQYLAPAITASQGNAMPEIETVYLRANELCEQINDRAEQFPVLFGLRSFYMVTGYLSKSHQLAEQLMDLAIKLDDKALLVEAHVGLASSHFYMGNIKSSFEHAVEGINHYSLESHKDHSGKYGLDPGVFCYARAGQTAWALGFPGNAVSYAQQGVALAKTINHPYSVVFSIHNQTMVYLQRCDSREALESAKLGSQLALEYGFTFLTVWSYYLKAWAFSLSRDIQNARLEIQRALCSQHTESSTTQSYLNLILAECYWHLQEPDRGLEVLAKPFQGHFFDVERLRLQAEFYLLSLENSVSIDQVTACQSQAEALFGQALTLSDQQGTKSYSLRIALGLSRLLNKLNRDKEAYELLNNVYLSFSEGFDTVDSLEAVNFLDRLTKKTG